MSSDIFDGFTILLARLSFSLTSCTYFLAAMADLFKLALPSLGFHRGLKNRSPAGIFQELLMAWQFQRETATVGLLLLRHQSQRLSNREDLNPSDVSHR